MTMKHRLVAGAAGLLALVPGVASAAPILGSFSLTGFNGTFIGAVPTALGATGLDIGTSGSVGNGYGTAGTATIGNGQGSFAGLASATISDIALGALANPTSSFYINFGNNLLVTFSNAAISRSPLGTSLNVTGDAAFTDGVASDATTGTFSLVVNSQRGDAANPNFTFTGNASAASPVPEPAAWAMMILGVGAVGFALRRQKVRVSYAA